MIPDFEFDAAHETQGGKNVKKGKVVVTIACAVDDCEDTIRVQIFRVTPRALLAEGDVTCNGGPVEHTLELKPVDLGDMEGKPVDVMVEATFSCNGDAEAAEPCRIFLRSA